MEQVHHVGVVFVQFAVKVDNVLVFVRYQCLVEHAQHLVEAVVNFAMQQRYLHNNAIVCETVDKGVRVAVRHLAAIIVKSLVINVHHRLFDVAHTVAKQIHGHHGHGVASLLFFLQHVFLGIVLGCQVTTEAQGFGVEPSLLQLYQYQALRAVALAHLCGEIYSEHRQIVTCDIGVLMAPHLNSKYLLFEQGREYGAGYAFIFHHEFEHRIVYGVGYCYFHDYFTLWLNW